MTVCRPERGPKARIRRSRGGLFPVRRGHISDEVSRFVCRPGGEVDHDVADRAGLVKQVPELVRAHR